ncbi:MAG: hypothetical protein JXB49_15205 [Bacteroidales bacterium]|nr:hypothetical protein [Bacteroidales bacterium]
MKNKLLILALSVFMAGTILNGCKSSADKVEDAQMKVQDAEDKVKEARLQLDQAVKDSIIKFKEESEEKISEQENIIAEFKEKLINEKKANRAIYEKKLAELEQKNSEMKAKLEQYREEEQDKWSAFKDDFNHDMEELGKALKNFSIENQ